MVKLVLVKGKILIKDEILAFIICANKNEGIFSQEDEKLLENIQFIIGLILQNKIKNNK